MEYKFKHEQKFFQKMTLTPQMRHSIKLLGMSTKDINEYIDSAVASNPFLQKTYDRKKYDSGSYSLSYSPGAPGRADYESSGETLSPRESLISQLRMLNLDGTKIKVAEHLIYEMDEGGYIKIPLEEVAEDFGISLEEVEETLEVIQSLEPPGIGARDIKDCLKLQLKRMGKGEDSLECILADRFLHEIAREDIGLIAKDLSIDKENVRSAISNIKRLNPKPASTMLGKKADPIIPDLLTKIADGKIHLRTNSDWLPNLSLYNPYEEDRAIMEDDESRQFVKNNINSAKGLIDGLKRREETMCRVTDFILNFHKNEVIENIDEIRSLTIKDVSTALNLHPSTINRAVSNKYIEINNKVIPLKNLLSHAVKKENGEHTSKVAVKKRIEEIIKSEDKREPLSDQAILEILSKEGIIIKRRTIAKYRNALRILPTYLRKKVA